MSPITLRRSALASCVVGSVSLLAVALPAAAEGTAVQIDRIRHYADHPGFVAASVDATLAALDRLGAAGPAARLVFVTHSIPATMAETAGPEPRPGTGAYVDWHRSVASTVTGAVEARRGSELQHPTRASRGRASRRAAVAVCTLRQAARRLCWCRRPCAHVAHEGRREIVGARHFVAVLLRLLDS